MLDRAGTPTPLEPDASEDDQRDSPLPDGNAMDDNDDVQMEEGLEDQTPPVESDADSRPATPAAGRSSARRRGRAGRPGRGRPRKEVVEDRESRAGSETGTPRRRGGRGRGWGRWGKLKGGASQRTTMEIDKEGTQVDVVNDEADLPEDPEGETKVDKNGYLQGGREYRVRTFPIEGKGDRLYMLSTEPARCVGFRDSYLFFNKHLTLNKVALSEDDKRDLIERDIIPHSYKGRALAVVTARSVFREFGARIIVGGKKVMDDYQAAAARANGDREGELAVPEDNVPSAGEAYDRNRYVAWHGASAVYHTSGPSVPAATGKVIDPKKRRAVVTGANWMLEHARATRSAFKFLEMSRTG